MPAPEPCGEPACASKSDAMKKMFAKAGGSKADKPLSSTNAEAVKPAADSVQTAAPCPPDRDELGRHSWTLLHSVAAYFPSSPTVEQSSAAARFIQAIADLYPCRHCAEDFKLALESHPPRVTSRAELSVWMCEAHNRINRRLGKPEFSCRLEDLDARWRNGGQDCDYTGVTDDEQ